MAEDEFENIREATYLEEAGEVNGLVQLASQGGPEQSAAAYPRFKQILEKYQESPHLLDPHLPNMVAPLADALREAALQDSSQSKATVHHLSKMLWVVASVRGCKTVVKFFPHSASDLEPVAALLGQLHTKAEGGMSEHWEAQSVVLLWLSQLVLLPFTLALLDSSLIGAAQISRDSTPPLVRNLVELCKCYLGSPASSRDMAALLLARLLTRPDTEAALQDFLEWSLSALDTTDHMAVFLVPGVTHALAAVMAIGERNKLLAVLPRIWDKAMSLLSSNSTASRSVLTRKLAVKLVQRMAMVLLPPRESSSWLQSPANLAAMLQNGSSPGNVHRESPQRPEDDLDVPDGVEDVLDVLLKGLQDSDTVVRWSAAKGLGRITARLPKILAAPYQDLGDEVVEQVLELFQEVHSDTAWHGACLTLAELSRRGLLLPYRLEGITPLIAKALQLDIRRGAHSVGAHVRDAAAYVCWAFARAYPAVDMAPTVTTLAPALLSVACYDREVNCRRAAAAAFQESVGRQGAFPHGIDIVTAADYFSLSSRSQAYLSIAPYIAGFPEYSSTMRVHLLHVKLQHWEKSLRELTSRALAALVPIDPAFYSTEAIDLLLPLCTDSSLEVRHGAVLGLAELLLACHKQQQPFTDDRVPAIVNVPGRVAGNKLLRGKGGEIMRAGVCRLIECTAKAGLPLEDVQLLELKMILDDSLRHQAHSIQTQAVQAFAAFCSQYLQNSSSRAASLAQEYLEGLRDASPAVRRGCASALGALPHSLLQPAAKAAIFGLAKATQIEEQPELRDAESRAAAVQSLTAVTVKLLDHSSPSQENGSTKSRREASQSLLSGVEEADIPAPSPDVDGNPQLGANVSAGTTNNEDDTAPEVKPDGAGLEGSELLATVEGMIFDTLLHATEDYTIDNRGDVGSWVREAAMRSLVTLLQALFQAGADARSCARYDLLVRGAVSILLQQSVERIARVRETALKQLGLLLKIVPADFKSLEAREPLSSLSEVAESASISSLEGIGAVAQLLAFETYQPAILQGLVFSIGGIDGSLAEAASRALLQQCKTETQLDALCSGFIRLWRKHQRSSRLATAILKTADVLLSAEALGRQHPLTGHLAGELLELVKEEIRACKDVARLSAAVSVLCQVLQSGGALKSSVLGALTALLVSRFPRVRQNAAEQMYLQFLGEESSQSLEEISEVLLSTSWDSSIEEARASQKKLLALLSL